MAEPSLSSLTPRGLLPGKPTEVTVKGQNLTSSTKLWSPCGIDVASVEVADDGKSLKCQLTPSDGATIRVVGVVAHDASGVSDPLLLMVDDLPSSEDNGHNHSAAEAQTLSSGGAVDGEFDGPASDFYRIPMSKDQTLSFEIVAHRLGESVDPVMRLFDAAGHEIALADDNLGTGADCHLDFRSPIDQEVILEVRDNRFRKGMYRLRVGDFPLVSSAFPLGARRGATARFGFVGDGASEDLMVIERLPLDGVQERMAISVKRPGGASSAMVEVAVSSVPETRETDAGGTTVVTVPCAVNGRLSQTQEVDRYEFALVKGQRIHCRGDSRRFGTPVMLHLELFNSKSESVAQATANDSDDCELNYTAGEEGLYQLVVRDLVYRGGTSFTYRVAVETMPDFDLVIKQDDQARTNFSVAADDRAVALNVTVQRHGYAGPIRLSTLPENPQLRLYNHTIAAGKNETRLYVVLPAEMPEHEFYGLQFVGTADPTVVEQPAQRIVRTEPTLRARQAHVAYARPWADGLFTIGVVAQAEPFFDVTGPSAPVELKRGASTEIPIALERKNEDFKDPIKVFANNLPDSCKTELIVEDEKYRLKLTCGDRPWEGPSSLQLVAIGELGGRTSVREFPVEIVASAQEAAVTQEND